MPSALNLFVRIFGDSGQFREDMAQDKATVDEFLAGLGQKDLTVEAHTLQAQEELDAVKAKMAAMKDAVIAVGLTDADAMAKMDEIIAKEEEIREVEIHIDAITAKADEQIAEMKARIEALKKETVHLHADSADAKEKLEEIAMLEDTIKKRTIRVDLETKSALAKLGELEAEMKSLQDEHTKILVEDGSAREKVTKLRADIESLTNKTLDLKLNDKQLAAKLQAIRMDMDRIQETTSTIHLKDADAQARLDELIAKEDLLRNKTVRVNVDDKGSTKQLANNAQQAGGFLQTLGYLALGLGPSLIPIGASLSGIGAFAVIAKSNITQVVNAQKQLQTAQAAVNKAVAQVHAAKTYQQWLVATQNLHRAQANLLALENRLGPSMMQAVNALNQFESYWKSYVASFRPQVLHDFIDGIRTLKALLTDMRPVIQAGGKALDMLFKSLDKSLSSKGAAAGFQRFANYIIKETPSVLRFFGQLGTAIGQLLKAFAPGGGLILGVATQLLKLLNDVLRINPIIGKAAAALLQGFGVFKLISPILSTFMATTGPWGLLITGIIAGIILLITHWGQIKKWWNQFAIWIKEVWDKVVTWFESMWSRMKKEFAKWGPDALLVLAPWLGIPLLIYRHWGAIEAWFKRLWDKVVAGVKSFGSDFQNNIQQIGDEISNFFASLGQDALHWGENLIGNFIKGLKATGSQMKGAVSSAAGHIANYLGFHSPAKEGPGADADKWAPNLMNMFTSGIRAGIPKLRATLNQVLVPPGAANMMTVGGVMAAGAAGHTFHLSYSINGPVYGVDDLHAAIRDGVYEHAVPAVLNAVKPTARAMGVSQ